MTDQLRQAAQAVIKAWDNDGSTQTMEDLRTALEQQAEPPPEWPLIKNILAEYGLQAISFVAEWKAAQQQAEPVAFYDFTKGFRWAKPTKIVAPTIVDVPPMPLYITAAQRPWVGLTDEEIESAISDGFARGLDDGNVSNQAVIHYVRVIEAALKEHNK